jgi:hypothetical protein
MVWADRNEHAGAIAPSDVRTANRPIHQTSLNCTLVGGGVRCLADAINLVTITKSRVQSWDGGCTKARNGCPYPPSMLAVLRYYHRIINVIGTASPLLPNGRLGLAVVTRNGVVRIKRGTWSSW